MCGFQSAQLFARDSGGRFLIDDRNIFLETTSAYPYKFESSLSGRHEVEEFVSSMKTRFLVVPFELKREKWTEYGDVKEVPYLYTFSIDKDPWQTLTELCNEFGLLLYINSDGNVVMKYPNNPLLFNTHSLDVDSGTNCTYTSNTLTDSTKAWPINYWAGGVVEIIDHQGKGQIKKIFSNDATTLVVTDWTVRPSSAARYVVAHTEDALRNFIVYDENWIQIPPAR